MLGNVTRRSALVLGSAVLVRKTRRQCCLRTFFQARTIKLPNSEARCWRLCQRPGCFEDPTRSVDVPVERVVGGIPTTQSRGNEVVGAECARIWTCLCRAPQRIRCDWTLSRVGHLTRYTCIHGAGEVGPVNTAGHAGPQAVDWSLRPPIHFCP